MKSLLVLACLLSASLSAFATPAAQSRTQSNAQNQENLMDELDPFDPNIEAKLLEMDKQYRQETGKSPYIQTQRPTGLQALGLLETDAEKDCYRLTCTVYARVIKSEQRLYLYVNGQLQNTWKVSTGVDGHLTPNFDTHPNGRIYDAYSSSKFPGGDYMGLGNMPYAVFISGGFAIHGTTVPNFAKLGSRASHGCIRLHSDNGKIFNRLVRQYGIKDTWITVEN